jgi:tetratricopeptide (TPR) repeat protein
LDAKQSIDACRAHMSRLLHDESEMLAEFWSERLAEKDYFSLAAVAFAMFASRFAGDKMAALELAHLHLNAFELDASDTILDDVERRFGSSATICAMRARIFLTRGDLEAAASAALGAIAMNKDAVPAYVILSEIAPEFIDAEKEAHLCLIIANDSLPVGMRIGGRRALGRVYEKRGDYENAFAAFAAAKSLSKESAAASGLQYDQKSAEANVRTVVARYPGVFAPPGGEKVEPLKVFVIGMPRSGSTLIEQILSRHSKAASVGESMNIPSIANWVARESKRSLRPYRTYAAQMQKYYRNTYECAAAGATCIVDKNLFNFERCGLIADLDPHARFILTLREPADIALSVFRTGFLAAHPWSNDLEDIAHMQASFEFLVDHWRRILGDRVLVVRHEELVADFEASVRRMLEFCGLEFEPECLAFHEGKRRVFTVSAAQVRQPLNAEGVGRWRNYERHLEGFARSLDAHRKRLAAGA